MQDSISVESTKPKFIKAYPKNLYAATPFSAYYDKKPVGTRDGLVKNNPINRNYIQDSSCVKESELDNVPSTIFYYGNIKSTRPIQAQEIQQISRETTQESLKESPNTTSLQTEPAEINHIIRQVIQEFMDSQATQKSLESKESWEKSNQEIAEENQVSQNQHSKEDTLFGMQDVKQSLATHLATQDETITKILDLQALNYTPSSFSTKNIPSYGYRFEGKLEKKTNALESQSPIIPSHFSPPTLEENPKNTESLASEVINLFDNSKEHRAKQNVKIQGKESLAPTQTAQVESCVPFANQTHLESLREQEARDKQISSQIIESQRGSSDRQENISHPLDKGESRSLVKSIPENESLLGTLDIAEAPQSKESQDFILPKLEFLQAPQEERVEIDEGEIDRKINDLLGKLRMFKIEGDIVRTYSGPIVTTFEFRPSPNVKVSRILTLQDDLAMALRAKTIRIQAPVPGKDVVGIEIPNQQIETIYLREILEHHLFANSTSPLTLALGKDIVGNPFITDLKKLPHLLIAGTTGSGKSVGINAMILSLLYKNSPDRLKLIMIDPKMLEFSIYNEIPHLLTPVITQPKKAIIALENTVKEMERRYALMSEARIKNIEGYNQKAEIEGFEPFPYIVVIIDELADLMMSGGKEAEVSISRLAQMARASGIHLIVATQRPSVDVVTGLIKANLPSRISYKVGQKIDSKVILDSFGAESLLGRGDMLFTPPGGGIVRLHAPWSTEAEIEKIVDFIKSQRPPQYDENFMPSEDEVLGLRAEGETDELYEEAKRIILSDGKTSISYIQRRLGIGYNKAANIIEQMQARGFLSEPNSKGMREILGN
ncbi:DNA translocase FtsK [uncultured Helicobacter sp.]|uniref:DNA translocase FtsK n=1 Tax=uncultured Helicobacter sp. TaxID=175537 RepID=UPI002637A547|nr:DNA translocase FtsK [uncultured Helicobacter sp.]